MNLIYGSQEILVKVLNNFEIIFLLNYIFWLQEDLGTKLHR